MGEDNEWIFTSSTPRQLHILVLRLQNKFHDDNNVCTNTSVTITQRCLSILFWCFMSSNTVFSWMHVFSTSSSSVVSWKSPFIPTSVHSFPNSQAACLSPVQYQWNKIIHKTLNHVVVFPVFISTLIMNRAVNSDYELDDRGLIPDHCVQTSCRPHQHVVHWVPGWKGSETDADH
jgi:hypothetical protein